MRGRARHRVGSQLARRWGPRAHRRDRQQARHRGRDRPAPCVGPRRERWAHHLRQPHPGSALRLRPDPGLPGQHAGRRQPRPGRDGSTQPRLLPLGRREDEGAPTEVPRARRDALPPRRRLRAARAHGRGGGAPHRDRARPCGDGRREAARPGQREQRPEPRRGPLRGAVLRLEGVPRRGSGAEPEARHRLLSGLPPRSGAGAEEGAPRGVEGVPPLVDPPRERSLPLEALRGRGLRLSAHAQRSGGAAPAVATVCRVGRSRPRGGGGPGLRGGRVPSGEQGARTAAGEGRGGRPRSVDPAERLDEPGDQGPGSGQARRHRGQDRLPRPLAGLLGARHRAYRPGAERPCLGRVRAAPAAREDRPPGGPGGVDRRLRRR